MRWRSGTGRAECLRAAFGLGAVMLLGAAAPTTAPTPSGPSTEVPFDVLNPDLYRSVTLKWNGGGSAPLCAVTRSRRDWEALTRTIVASAKGNNGSEPASDAWNRHAVLVVGRQLNIGRAPVGFHVSGVHRQGSTIEFDYSFIPAPPAGGTTWFAAVAIPKPLAATVTFKDAGRVVCTVQPMAGHWVSPAHRGTSDQPQSAASTPAQ